MDSRLSTQKLDQNLLCTTTDLYVAFFRKKTKTYHSQNVTPNGIHLFIPEKKNHQDLWSQLELKKDISSAHARRLEEAIKFSKYNL